MKAEGGTLVTVRLMSPVKSERVALAVHLSVSRGCYDTANNPFRPSHTQPSLSNESELLWRPSSTRL